MRLVHLLGLWMLARAERTSMVREAYRVSNGGAIHFLIGDEYDAV